MNNKILHLVKTLDGATWAFHQINELIKNGWEVHVASPTIEGRHKTDLLKTGAILHQVPVELPIKSPWNFISNANEFLEFVKDLNPAIIHSHFVSTTLMMRWCLKDSRIPRIFQVPGPLHLEHNFFGSWEILWANSNDYWIASSDFIKDLYLQKYNLPSELVFKSYYGIDLNNSVSENLNFNLREEYKIPKEAFLLGNVSYIYPPKLHLGQSIGLKGHELMLDALEGLILSHPDIWMIFIGNQWGKNQTYLKKLSERAKKIGQGRIIFTGLLSHQKVLASWQEIDLAIHIPLSENCGGVVEPLLAKTPVLASRTGGIPEVILDGVTGLLTSRNADQIIEKILYAHENNQLMKQFANKGFNHIHNLFDRVKTGKEISNIYDTIIRKTER